MSNKEMRKVPFLREDDVVSNEVRFYNANSHRAGFHIYDIASMTNPTIMDCANEVAIPYHSSIQLYVTVSFQNLT